MRIPAGPRCGRPRRLLSVVMALLLLAPVAGVRADQSDPLLDGLFRELAAAEGLEAQIVANRIWQVWLRIEDPKVAALLEQGMSAMGHGDIDEAIAHFDEVVALAPGFAEGWNKRATARFLNRDYAGSMLDIQRTLALEPRHFGAISGMGLILLDSGDPRGAKSAFEAVLEVYPASPGARSHLERLRRALGDSGA